MTTPTEPAAPPAGLLEDGLLPDAPSLPGEPVTFAGWAPPAEPEEDPAP